MPLAGDPHGGGGRDVEHHDVRRCRARRASATLHAGLEACAPSSSSSETIARLIARRAALGDGPAVAVRGRAERDADRRGHRRRERPEGVRGDAGEQRPRLARRRSGGASSAAGSAGAAAPKRASASGCSGTCSIGRRKSAVMSSKRAASGPKSARQRPPSRPEPGRGLLDRAVRRGAAAAVERVRVLDLRPPPASARARRGRSAARTACRRASGCAAEHSSWIRPGQRQLAAARAAAERVGGLEHGHVDALGGEREGGSEPVGPAADDDRACSCRHQLPVAARRG